MTDCVPIRTAVAGFGKWGPKLARNVAAIPGSTLAAVCDVSPGRLLQAGETHRGAVLTADFRSILDDPTVDAVIVATPAGTHFELAQCALQAGKHVLVEKPAAASSAEVRTLIATSERRGAVFAVDHTYLFSPAVRAVADLLEQGVLGSLVRLESWRHNDGVVIPGVPVHWDLACHDLSILSLLLPDADVDIAARRTSPDSPVNPTAISLRLHYPGLCLADIHVNWTAGQKQRRLVIEGTKGVLVYDDLEPEGKVQIRYAGARDPFVPALASTEPLRASVEDFLDCIRTGRRPASDGAAGLHVVRLLEAADESLRRGGQRVACLPARQTPDLGVPCPA